MSNFRGDVRIRHIMLQVAIHPKQSLPRQETLESQTGILSDRVDSYDIKDVSVEKRKDSLGELWWKFLSETTCHGFGKVGTVRGNRLRGVIWTLFLLTSLVSIVWFLVDEIRCYYTYPFLSKISLESFERMHFPAVTICNMGSKNKSKSSKSQKDTDYWLSVSNMAAFTNEVDWNDSYYKENGYFEPNSLEQELSLSMDVSKFILTSTFDFLDGQEFKPTLTSVGVCFTWNNDGNMTTKMSGSLYNLHVLLDIHRDLYEASFISATGVKVVVHEPGTIPDPINQGFVVAPGVSALASVTKKKFTFLPYPFKAFGDGYCLDTNAPDFVNKFHPTPYSVSVCKKFCLSEIIFKKCGCVNVGDLGNYPICSKYQISKCYLKEIGKLIYQDAQNVIQCDCPYPCHQMTYDVAVSTSQFPSDILVQVLSSHFNTSQERLKDNILEISIFYDKLNYFWMNQVPKYERIGNVLASIGGQMGLFIGASVLTMLEFMEIIFLVLLFIFKQLCFKPRKNPKDAVA
ncbi:acid-sensing ion channel 1-like [Saccostrea cucullata]|uniref:acid-sensing ion channel 1-like n=1 Tax=Saccostrea cuccullata TaxID=36930 RepID=UPI002ED2764C